MRSEHGVNALAEVLVSRLVGDMVKGAGPINQHNANLRNERSHLLISARRSGARHLVVADISALRSRFLLGTGTLAAIAATAFSLYFIHLADYLEFGAGPAPIPAIVAGLLAAALIGSGLYVCERMVEAACTSRTATVQRDDVLRFVVWAGLLAAVQFVIFTLLAGWEDVSSAPGRAALQYGTALAGLLLPVVGGFLLTETVRSGTEYRDLRSQRRIEDRMAEIDAMLERNDEAWRETTRTRAVDYWEQLQTFKLHKGIYDARRGHQQDPLRAFAASFAAFEREAERRFRRDPAEKLESFIPSGDGLADPNLRPYPIPSRPPARSLASGNAEVHVVTPAI